MTAAATVALVLLLATTAFGAGLSGRFSTTIGNLPKSLDGTWVLAIAGNGAYTVTFGGKLEVRGQATFSGSTVTVGHESGPLACTGAAASGTYAYTLSGAALRLRRERDSCTNRSFLLGHSFRKS